MTTTVVDGDSIATVKSDVVEPFEHRFAWGPTFAAAVVGTATIFFLLSLGAGVGLSLVPAPGLTSRGFLTLGAIYFLAAQAMGFAVGGHLVGRLIGPMAETDNEEEFRAAAHGLTVWGLCVTATAILVLISGWSAVGSSAIAGEFATPTKNSASPTPAVVAYWTDVLFRPPLTPMHAALAWKRYAQANNTTTDASPPTIDDQNQSNTVPAAKPMTSVPNSQGNVENDTPQAVAPAPSATPPTGSIPSSAPHVITIPTENDTSTASVPATQAPATRNLAADKAEVARILEASWLNRGSVSTYDRERIAELVSQDAGISTAEAGRRVDNAEAQMNRDQMATAEAARKIARNTSLWIAFSLFFGALVSTMAAISARWKDDRVTFGWRRSESR